MDVWEYRKLDCDFEKGAWRVRQANDAELANWKKGLPVVEVANQLGGTGWELVTSHPGPGSYQNSFTLWFRRRRT